MKCIVCGGEQFELIHHGTRDIPDVDVYKCCQCGGSQLSTFSQITDGFYENSGMHQNIEIKSLSDVQILEDDIRRSEMLKEFKGKILDFGCGGGGMLRSLMPTNPMVYGVELEDCMRDMLNANGIVCKSDINEYTDTEFDVITMFHVIEHLTEPYQILSDIKRKLKHGGQLIIETPNGDDALIQLYQCEAFKNFTYWGCHVFLYTSESLEFLLKKAGFSINWSRQIQRYPITNHLYWLSHQKPGGQNVWKDMNSDTIDKEYQKILESKKLCDTLLISVS